VNEVRKAGEKLTVDHQMTAVANEYADHLLQSKSNEDLPILEELLDKYQALGCDTLKSNKYFCIVGEAYYDAETGDERELAEAFMDAHGLLFELSDELKIILTPENTHIAVGLAYDKNQVKVVEVYSIKELKVTQLSATEDEGVEVKGQGLPGADHGIFACRIVNNKEKEIAVITPENIQATPEGAWVATFPGPLEDVFYSEKHLQIYLRSQKKGSIPYGEPF